MCSKFILFVVDTKQQCLKEEQQMIEDEASQFDTYTPYTEEEFVELLSNEEPSGNESEVENILYQMLLLRRENVLERRYC